KSASSAPWIAWKRWTPTLGSGGSSRGSAVSIGCNPLACSMTSLNPTSMAATVPWANPVRIRKRSKVGRSSRSAWGYLLLSLLQYRLRKTEFTAESALLELSSMHKVYLRDTKHRFHLSRVVTLTKKQELILKTIDKSLLNSYCIFLRWKSGTCSSYERDY